jgi:hypothetical protein
MKEVPMDELDCRKLIKLKGGAVILKVATSNGITKTLTATEKDASESGG